MPDEEVDEAVVDAPVDDEAPENSGDGGDVAAELTKFLTDHASASETEDQPEDTDTDKEPEAKPDAKAEVKADDKVPDQLPDDTEDDDEELQFLSKEEIDKKFSNSSKGLRAYAARITREFEPVAKLVNDLGGKEGIEKLEFLGRTMLGQPDPEGNSVMAFLEQTSKINPAFSEALQTHVFYGTIDSQPEVLNSLITANMGEGWTQEDLIVLAAARKAGHLDMNEIKELVGEVKLPDAVLKRIEAAEAKANKAEELEKRVGASDYKQKFDADLQLVSGKFREIATPRLAKHGFLPSKDDPPEVVKEKTWVAERMDRDIRQAMDANPNFQTLYEKIRTQQKGEDFAILQSICANIFKGIVRQATIDWAPYLTARIKTLGKVGRNIEARDPLPEDARDTGGKIETVKTKTSSNGADPAAELLANLNQRAKIRERGASAS